MPKEVLEPGAVAELAKDAAKPEEIDDIFGGETEETSVEEMPTEETPEEETSEETEGEETETETEVEPTAVVVPPIDNTAALVKALELAFPKAAPAVEAPKPLTQEEIDRALNVWKPTKEWQDRFSNPETQAEALQELSAGTARQAATMAQVMLQEQVERTDARLAPILEAQHKATVTQWRTDFDEAYPQLAKPELEPLLEMVTNQIKSSGYKATSKQDIFEKIAATAAALITGSNPAFKLDAPKTKTTTVKTTMPKLPTTTAGGGGGAGGGTKAPKATGNRSKGTEIFD